MPPRKPAAPSDQSADVMKREWDRRAEEDARFFIASGAADSEEAFRSSGKRELEGAVLDGIDLGPDAEALEIGCGVGRLLVPLSERIRRVHGVDISEAMIAKARAFCAGREIDAATTDGTLRGFRDGSLDFVFSFVVFQHIPERGPIRRYVEEAARVLRSGGLFRFQVDGRWRGREVRTATTYDGVKFSPAEARALLSGTGFRILDEWGAETHYHWITACLAERAPTARVTFRPRVWDEVLLHDLLARTGTDSPGTVAAKIVKGETSLRRALDPLEKLVSSGSDEEFVRRLHRALFAVDPEPDLLSSHVELLRRKVEERGDLLDIFLMGLELRDLLRPFLLPEAPWYRIEGLRALPAVPTSLKPWGLVRKAGRCLARLELSSAVDLACRAIVGSPPSRPLEALYTSLVTTRSGRRSLARRLLLCPPPRPAPGPPSPEKVTALAARVGLRLPAGASLAGGSFRGEGLIARQVLQESDALPDSEFLRLAYEKVLGRPADEEGERYWGGKLAAGDLNRPGLLRELLWSEELRQA